jgi:N-acetylglucosamine kinase-like BadF-type ATPase
VIESLLDRAVGAAALATDGDPVAATAQILLAGADLAEERAALHAVIDERNWSRRLVVENDTLALLRAGTDRGWGIAIVCGAGINCFGRAPDGRELRFASLGEISGDWGGGADVGLAALMAAARSADGRGPRSVLETAVPAHFGLGNPLEVSRALHERRMSDSRLAELAAVVFELCGEDAVAAGIVRRLADEVIAFASATLRRLELTQADPDIVLGGRLLRALPPPVCATITRAVQEAAPAARLVVASSEPIVGAALLGLDSVGAETAAKRRARTELDAAVLDLGPAPIGTGA